jgi:hypothetical protein
MKKMNLLVMSLVSAAALSFTSCSSNDDLAGDNAGQGKVDQFYMTLTIQTPNSNGTRTAVKDHTTENATPAESDVTSGTFYLVDANNKIVFTHPITKEEWAEKKIPTQGTNGKTTLQVPVKNVTAGTTYSVYFLANTTSESPLTEVFTSNDKFAKAYSADNNFAMFNENDADVKGNSHTVVFTSDNKDANSAAKVSSTINIERLTARIDEPKSAASTIQPYTVDASASDEEKKANANAVKAVKSLKLTSYAISNVANKTNVMQQWADATTLSIPTGIIYFQPTTEFGTKTLLQNYGYFNAVTTDRTQKDYIFENNSSDAATSMYFEYTVELSDEYKDKADIKDGTFYRYNKVIYSRIQDIIDAYKDQKAIFDGKDADTVVKELKDAQTGPDSEAKLDEFRKKYDIEVFNAGKTYYVQKIQDQYLGVANTIQRNSIYQLNVKNIFNVGAQVPNGGPDDRTLYYLDVEVSVNPWVLNNQDVDLK